jgi:hypothetical protein
MVKVYKTNMDDPLIAGSVLNSIREYLPGCDPSFDLEDCDNVLRIEWYSGKLRDQDIYEILADFGHSMEILL